MDHPKTDPLQGIIIKDENELFTYPIYHKGLSHSMRQQYNKFISRLGHRHPTGPHIIKAITQENRETQIEDLQKRFRSRGY